MKIYKIAKSAEDQIKDLDKDIKDIKKDHKDFASDIKDLKKKIAKIEKDYDSLNVGARQFWQQKTVFTSLERKIEKLDRLEQEWSNFKKELDSDVKESIEKKFRAQIK